MLIKSKDLIPVIHSLFLPAKYSSFALRHDVKLTAEFTREKFPERKSLASSLLCDRPAGFCNALSGPVPPPCSAPASPAYQLCLKGPQLLQHPPPHPFTESCSWTSCLLRKLCLGETPFHGQISPPPSSTGQ